MKEIKLSKSKNLEGKNEKDKAFKNLLSILNDLQNTSFIGISHVSFFYTEEAEEEYKFHCLATNNDGKFDRSWYTRLILAISYDYYYFFSNTLLKNNISVVIEHYDTEKPEIIFIVPKKVVNSKIYILSNEIIKPATKIELMKYAKEVQKRYKISTWSLFVATKFISPKIFFNESVFQTLEELPNKKPTSKIYLYVTLIILAIIIYFKSKTRR